MNIGNLLFPSSVSSAPSVAVKGLSAPNDSMNQGVRQTTPTLALNMDMGKYAAGFGKVISVPLNLIHPKSDFQEFLCGITVEFTLPAIRHKNEKMRRSGEICEKHCLAKDKMRCDHEINLKHAALMYYVNELGHFLTKDACLKLRNKDNPGEELIPFRTSWYQQSIVDDLDIARNQNTDDEVGRHSSELSLIEASRNPNGVHVNTNLYYPPFASMSPDSTLQVGLPLYLLFKYDMVLEIKTPSLSHCYHSNDDSTPYLLFGDRDRPLHDRPLQDTDLQVQVFLDIHRKHSPQFHIQQLPRQVSYYWPYFQCFSGMVDVNKHGQREDSENGQTWCSIEVPCPGNIMQILWFFSPMRSISRDGTQFVPLENKTKEHFNWRGLNGEDCFLEAELRSSNAVHVSRRIARHYRSNLQRNRNNKPQNAIYGYSWVPFPSRCDIDSASLLNISSDLNHPPSLILNVLFQPYVKYCKWHILVLRPNAAVIQNGNLLMETFKVPEEKRM